MVAYARKPASGLRAAGSEKRTANTVRTDRGFRVARRVKAP
jgi:hypothetical protein